MNSSIISKRNAAKKLRERSLKQQDYLEKYNVGNDAIYIKCLDCKTYNINAKNAHVIIWYDNDKINVIGREFTNDIGKIQIDINNIICFLRYGDFYTSSNIKGGDSSFERAALGYLLAGDVGAIIASRNPIVSSTEVHDKRETLLIVREDNIEKYLFFEPELYNYLMHLIPTKEINYRNFSADK
ncbi:MAG: hypothetical protein JJT76_14960 [Clostridiaceae bacterium]|nr:hypothetical protein [Clostridiaceae bacterium]